MRTRLILLLPLVLLVAACRPQAETQRPRVLVSTDIGGTDPDDNQSMAHLLMYSHLFDLEGLVSSPSYGPGSKGEILRMIDLWEQDLPALKAATGYDYPSVKYLRSITKEGHRGLAPFDGFEQSTEGSEWIVQCARKQDSRPLYVLVWGGLEDVGQALHDAPDIADRIRIYWIGGPNKKWSADCYAYIVSHFPDLWMIENNDAYRGFIHASWREEQYGEDFWEKHMRGHGVLGDDFQNYYKGIVKMGDTPSLLYMMNPDEMDPADPEAEHWGGRFERMSHSARRVFDRPLSVRDTVPVFSVIEMHLQGPEAPADRVHPAFTLHCLGQDWSGYSLGGGNYCVRYAPKAPGRVSYTIDGAVVSQGEFTVENVWPGEAHPDNWPVGKTWWTDVDDPDEFEGQMRGAKTVSRWRDTVLADWARLFGLLK